MESTTTKKLRRLVLILLCALCLNNHVVSARDAPSPIIKTLKFKDGDIVDCYDINKQPTLDHPLLKNHKIQMRPSSLPDGVANFFPEQKNLSIFSEREECPSGSVPIPRSRKDVSKSMYTTDIAYIGQYFRGQQKGFVTMKTPVHPTYNGGSGWMSLYNISLGSTSQSSGTFIMIHNGSLEDMNLISAGWMVSPRINGDTNPRLYVYWTADGYKTSCYNNNGCTGFVQIDKSVYPTFPFSQVSSPGNIKGCEYLVYKDIITGDWWLVVNLGGGSIRVGYWPKEIFPNLGNGGPTLAWGGIAFAGDEGQSPPMGSGHIPKDDFDQNSFFRNIRYIDEAFEVKMPSNVEVDYLGDTGCYSLRNDGFRGDQFGYCFTYGGPGGNCGV